MPHRRGDRSSCFEQMLRRSHPHLKLGSAIAQQIRVNLAPNYAKQHATKYVPNTEAYELYLQGLFYLNMRTADAIRKSIEYFRRSTDKDTGFALAYAGRKQEART